LIRYLKQTDFSSAQIIQMVINKNGHYQDQDLRSSHYIFLQESPTLA